MPADSPPSKVIVMNVDGSGITGFCPEKFIFETDQSPQFVSIDTSQLHQHHKDAFIVKLKIDDEGKKHFLAAFVKNGETPPRMRRVDIDETLEGRIDSIMMLFDMPTEAGNNTDAFGITLSIDSPWLAIRSVRDYDPQVGNEPPPN